MLDKEAEGVEHLVDGEVEVLGDSRVAPETRALWACDEDEEEVERDRIARESLEVAAMEKVAVNPGELSGDGAHALELRWLSAGIGHGELL